MKGVSERVPLVISLFSSLLLCAALVSLMLYLFI